MKMHDECIPCLVSQVIKTAHLTGAEDRETLYKQVFAYMAQLDFNKTNPEVAGDTYAMLKKHIGNEDPYKEVRGAPVVNDSTEEDAYTVGINEYATIISNGDISQGTVIEHTTVEFQAVYHKADLVISKGQANYETLSDRQDQNIYFMLITKCKVIANDIGVPERSLVCLNHSKEEHNQ